MIMAIRFTWLSTFLLALAFFPTPPALADVTPETQARIDALRRQVTELENRERQIQSRVAVVAHTDTAAQGLTNARVDKDRAEHQKIQMQRVVDAYARSAEEMEEMQRQVESDIDRRIEEANDSLARSAGRKTLEYAGTQGLTHLLAAETGPLLSIGIKVIDHAGRAIIADINEDQLGEQILAERRNLVRAMEVIVMLSEQSSAETVRIRDLEDLQQQFSENLDALATARQRLDRLTGDAHSDANVERVTDAAGDEEEKRKQRGFGVRLCDPSQRHKPTGVGPARKGTGSSEKSPKKDKTDKAVSDDQECTDITGFWNMVLTTHAMGRSFPTPSVRTEIAMTESDGEPVYEVYPASKEKAPSGPILRCSLEGNGLNCQRRVQPQICPPSKYVWMPMEMNVSADIGSISGEFQQVHTMDTISDPSGCTLQPNEGPVQMDYQFEWAEESSSVK